jgi:DNA polymerase IIIc chi subunit
LWDEDGLWDWDELLAIAFFVGIVPDQFWAMTFREFAACLEGHRRREELDIEKRDWELRTHLSAWSKKRFLPGELSGKRKPDLEEVVITTAEQFHAEAQRRMALAAAKKEASRGRRRR